MLVAAYRLGLAAFLALVFVCGFYLSFLPDVRPLRRSNPRTTAYMELRKEQARAKGQKLALRHEWIAFDRISPHLKDAVLTAEDDMFYRHDGVDWEAVRVALEKDLRKGKLAHGGSTITQQVAKNLYLSPSRNPLRKLKELLIARKLEKELGKRRIFELYLNIAEWGKGVFGCEAAARAYFGKSAADLTVDEAVSMAVVLPNPRRWNPAERGKYVERNMRRVLGRMRASGLVDDEVGLEGLEDLPEPIPSALTLQP